MGRVPPLLYSQGEPCQVRLLEQTRTDMCPDGAEPGGRTTDTSRRRIRMETSGASREITRIIGQPAP